MRCHRHFQHNAPHQYVFLLERASILYCNAWKKTRQRTPFQKKAVSRTEKYQSELSETKFFPPSFVAAEIDRRKNTGLQWAYLYKA